MTISAEETLSHTMSTADAQEKTAQSCQPHYRAFSVDDEPVVHAMLEKIIATSGLPVELCGSATTAEEALSQAEQLKPDVLLMDIQLGDTSGLELAAQMPEALGYSPRLIYLTAYGRFDYAREAIRLGAVDYLLKPINPQELRGALRRAVNMLQADRIHRLEQASLKAQIGDALPRLSSIITTSSNSRNGQLARQMKAYIDEHYTESISLTTAADHLKLSASYLGPLFKSECGISFRGYLRLVRIARAKQMMRDQSMNLEEIARAVGFQDENYFSQVFLEVTGVRPGEYRGAGRRWVK